MNRTGITLNNFFPLRALVLLATLASLAAFAAGCPSGSDSTSTDSSSTSTSGTSDNGSASGSTDSSATDTSATDTASAGSVGQISGAGATFPYPVYSKWADSYQKETGIGLNYQSIGSGGGIKQIQAKTVTFGATDAPLSGEELAESGLVQWPMVMGGIVPVINLEGIEAGQLTLDGSTLADIFMGKVTMWNDPAIAALNEGVSLPETSINVVTRSDGSGTTYNFTYYLAEVSEAWKTGIGVDKAVEWPVGIGAKGNEGVAQNVAGAKNSIGYVEYAYAKQNNMTHCNMINQAGKTVSPDADAFAAAAASADWNSVPGYGVILANQPGDATWPMTAATFILMYKTPEDDASSTEALKFFKWAFEYGSEEALGLDYIPMPASVVESVEAMWSSEIKGEDGQPLV
ncbi:MAG: phosphate ABC transporter substrate-binding protein PstS [Planctomycetales bacterium]|nr:phosphate ABC transporter substrate-binding protein PstS [bacterium]UNM06972.1 MAG: phosphate ABC transporter substrate-binding protein PstS [Planctomycetales bacterium]